MTVRLNYEIQYDNRGQGPGGDTMFGLFLDVGIMWLCSIFADYQIKNIEDSRLSWGYWIKFVWILCNIPTSLSERNMIYFVIQNLVITKE